MRKEIELTRKTSVLGGNKQAREAFMLKEDERKEQEAIINELESNLETTNELAKKLEEERNIALDEVSHLKEVHADELFVI